ncbi:MAG: GH39 family glycosyl hydrolase [Spirochaetia bacterium]
MVTVESIDHGQHLNMPWQNCIAVGRAYDLLRKDLTDHLKMIQKDFPFKYCRFHALFHDDMGVVSRGPDGTLKFRWHQVDKIYDSLLELDLRPFVELNPMPGAMASGTQQMFYYKMNVTPPQQWEEWRRLVKEFASHIRERYGLEEIRKWYYEVWNEPNLSGFWSGTKEEYFRLYDKAASALKETDPFLRVGGPATSKGGWITDLLEHCSAKQVPIDFISTHLYPQDEFVFYPDRKDSPHEEGFFFKDMFKRVQREVKESSFPDIEIHWTEWNTQSAPSSEAVTWSENIYVDNLFAASFIVKTCIEIDSLCDSAAYWTASDIFEEGGIPHTPFSCTYGLVTVQGIPKAGYNGFKFLSKMKGSVCHHDFRETPPSGCGCLITEDNSSYRILCWNNRFPQNPDRPVWNDTIKIPLPRNKQHNPAYSLITGRIRPGAGSPWETWIKMGKPANPTSLQEEVLRAASVPEYKTESVTAQGDVLYLDFTVGPDEVLFAELRPRDEGFIPEKLSEEQKKWDAAMGDQNR